MFDFTELPYADDMLLVTKRTEEMNKLLHAIEKESKYYNLRLNKEKCVTVEMQGSFAMRFEGGTLVS